MNMAPIAMSVAEMAHEALHRLTMEISRRELESIRLKERGIPDPDAVRFVSESERAAYEEQGKNFWKEVKIALTERDKNFARQDIIDNNIMPAVYALADWLYQRENHSPLGLFPVCEAQGLDIATVFDPATGHSLRARRWNSAQSGSEMLAFEICSRDYRPQDALVGPVLTA